MALLRVTPTTALSTVKQLVSDLSRWVRESGPLTAVPRLSDDIEEVARQCGDAALDVELLFDALPDEPVASRVAAQLAPSLTAEDLLAAAASGKPAIVLHGSRAIRLHAASLPGAAPRRAGTARPPVLGIVLTKPLDEFPAAILSAADDRPAVFVLTGDRSKAALPGSIASSAWYADIGPFDPERTLVHRLTSAPFTGIGEALRADGLVRALESLTGVFGLALDQESRAIKAKRTIAQQAVSRVQQRTQAQTASDLAGDLRARIQRHFADFSRGVEDRAQNAFTPQIGTMWRSFEAEVGDVQDLQIDARAKTVATRLADEVEEGVLSSLRRRMFEHCIGDLVTMRDLFRLVQQEIEEVLAKAGQAAVIPQFQHLPEERLTRLLEMHVLFQRQYAGEMPRKGWFEYVMMARRYQTILLMFMSAFGLSFLRSYRVFMIPSAIVLLSFGVVNVVNSVKREQAESRGKELDRAREFLRNEARRILVEVSRGWTTAVTQHLSDQMSAVLAHIEATSRDQQSRQSQTATQERQRLQRQLQSLETSERKLQAAARGRDTVASAVAQLRGELRQLVGTSMRAPQAS